MSALFNFWALSVSQSHRLSLFFCLMSLLARFRTEPLFIPDNAGSASNREEESGLSTNSQLSSEDLYNPAEMMPSQPSTRSSSTLAVPFSPQMQHIIKISGNSVCQKLELPDGSLDEFTKVSTSIIYHECTLPILVSFQISRAWLFILQAKWWRMSW